MIMLNLFCACIVLNEITMYNWTEIVGLIVCAGIQIGGVYLIVYKPSFSCIKESQVVAWVDPFDQDNINQDQDEENSDILSQQSVESSREEYCLT